MSWPIKRNDREPAYRGRLMVGGQAVNLAGRTVKFIMTHHTTNVVKVNAAATIMDQAARVAAGIPADQEGWVEYAWGPTDTDTSGLYRAEWEVTSAGKARTFPPKGYLFIEIGDDLA